MTRLGFALSMVTLVAAAAWAYHVNYRTKMALGRIDKLRAQIAAEREAAQSLEVEWAYLNAPERLSRLVKLNNDRLQLVPLRPEHFGDVAVVPYRPVETERPNSAPPTAIVVGPRVDSPAVPTLGFMPAPTPPPRPASWRR